MRLISLIILSIFLIHTSPASAGVGDVYYCVINQHIKIESSKLKRSKNEKFTFKRTAQGLIFGKGGYFNGAKMQRKIHDDGDELFNWGDQSNGAVSYVLGSFTFVYGGYDTATAMQGTCSVFE